MGKIKKWTKNLLLSKYDTNIVFWEKLRGHLKLRNIYIIYVNNDHSQTIYF